MQLTLLYMLPVGIQPFFLRQLLQLQISRQEGQVHLGLKLASVTFSPYL